MDVARGAEEGKTSLLDESNKSTSNIFCPTANKVQFRSQSNKRWRGLDLFSKWKEEGRTKTPRQRGRNAIKSRKGQQKGEIVHSSCDLGCRKESGSLLRRNFFRNRERPLITAPLSLHHFSTFKAVSSLCTTCLSVCQGCLLCTYTSTVLLRHPKNKQCHLRSLKRTLQFRRSDCLH